MASGSALICILKCIPDPDGSDFKSHQTSTSISGDLQVLLVFYVLFIGVKDDRCLFVDVFLDRDFGVLYTYILMIRVLFT